MIRRWGHAHSLMAGVAGGLILTQHAWLVFCIGLALGGALVFFSRQIRRGLHGATAFAQAKLETERERRANLRASRLVKLRGVKAKRVELDKAFQRGYIEGSLSK